MHSPFPDATLSSFLFRVPPYLHPHHPDPSAGTSGGYLAHILAAARARHPGSRVTSVRGRNADVVEFVVEAADGSVLLRTARYYGFRNIQNLVRRLKPTRL